MLEVLKDKSFGAPEVFKNFLKDAENENSPENIKNHINKCIDNCYLLIRALEDVRELESFDLTEISSLATNSAKILNLMYEHCSKSEEIYGANFVLVSDTLAQLFRQAFELQTILLNVLSLSNLPLELNSDCEHEWNEILRVIGDAVCSILNLDAKAMSQLWKGYIVLLKKYDIRQKHDVSKPVVALCSYVEQKLSILELDKNFNDLNSIKVIGYLMKITFVLLEAYRVDLVCHKEILKVLSILTRFSQVYLLNHGLDERLSLEVSKQLTHVWEPMVSNLCEQRLFSLACCHATPKNPKEAFGFVMVCCTVLKKLTQCKHDTRQLWFGSEGKILSWIFNVLPFCEKELQDNLEYPGVLIVGQTTRNTDVYEHILTSVASFVLTCTVEEFVLMEKLLLANTLQSNPWPALLAIDTWCLVARFADVNLCFEQLKCLSRIWSKAVTVHSCRKVEICHLSSLICRLLPLVLEHHRKSLFATCPGLHSLNSAVAASVDSFLADLESKELYCNMENYLLNVIDFNDEQKTALIVNLWKFDPERFQIEEWAARFLFSLCRATSHCLSFLPCEDVCMILKNLNSVLQRRQNTLLRLGGVRLINALATLHYPASEATLFKTLVADLCKELLLSERVIVAQHALEAFCHFSRVTFYPDIITLAVGKNKTVQLQVQNFLLNKTTVEPSFDDFQIILEVKHNYIDPVEPCSKRLKLDMEEQKESIPPSEDVIVRWLQLSEVILEHYPLINSNEEVKLMLKKLSSVSTEI